MAKAKWFVLEVPSDDLTLEGCEGSIGSGYILDYFVP